MAVAGYHRTITGVQPHMSSPAARLAIAPALPPTPPRVPHAITLRTGELSLTLYDGTTGAAWVEVTVTLPHAPREPRRGLRLEP